MAADDGTKMYKLLLIYAVSHYLSVLVAPEVIVPVSVTYTIREEMEEGKFVGNLATDANLDEKYDEATLKKLRFRFLSQPVRQSFNLEMTTGAIMTGGQIDREEICPMEALCEIKFDVAVQPVQYFQIIKVTIIIEDLNDNWPEFLESSVTHQILESASPGTSIPLPSANDPDSPTFGIQRYKLFDDTGKFELRVTDKLDGSTDVKVILLQSLDRESVEEYTLKVVAVDGGGLTGYVEVYITVMDANDYDPMFYNRTYEVTASENIPIGTTVVSVQAWDPDLGINSEIRYKFSSRTESRYGNLFSINDITGDITVTGEIDYEKNQIYHLSVLAKDMGPGSLPADATVIIHVLDENDNPPEITINTLTESTSLISEVTENADSGTFVAHVTIQDMDSGDNGKFNCFLNDNHFQLEKLDHGEYQIVTAVTLDRETRNIYDILVECTDKGEMSQTSIKDLRVVVSDKNDHSPQFDRDIYKANIIENNYEGAIILHVNATDQDQGRNADIRYILPDEMKGILDIDADRGILTAAVKFDREEYPQIRFKIIAKDQGEPSKTGTAAIVITIQDINDETPTFTQSHYPFYVFENQASGARVGVVTAIDRDGEAPNNQFMYSISRIETDLLSLNAFEINAKTGVLTTRKYLDRERQSEYHLVIRARDLGEPKRTGSASVTVFVDDDNDHDPEFIFPSKNNYTVQVSAHAPIGYLVTKITARDNDTDQNAELTYSITKGNSRYLFKIHSKSGFLTTAKPLYEASQELYPLEITVTDSSSKNRRIAKAPIDIYVNKSIAVLHTNTPGEKGRGGGSANDNSNPSTGGDFFSGNNLLIVIALAAASAIIAVILIIAIIFIHRRSKREKNGECGAYNCRQEEAKKILQSNQNNSSDDSNSAMNSLQKGSHFTASPPPPPPQSHHQPHAVNNGGLHYGSNDKLGHIGGGKKEVCFNMVENGTGITNPVIAAKQRLEAQHNAETCIEGNHQPQDNLSKVNISPEVVAATTGSDTISPDTNARQWHPSQKDLDAHHLVGTIKQRHHHDDGDSSYSGDGSYQDSGKGTSDEGDYCAALTAHPTGGNIRKPYCTALPTGGDQQMLSNSNSNPASSYNKRRPDFRTFSPVNPILKEDSLDERDYSSPPPSYQIVDANTAVQYHHHTLPHSHANHPQNYQNSRTLSPATTRKQQLQQHTNTLPIIRTKPMDRGNSRELFGPEGKNDNSYKPGYTVDPDDLNYTINEFMLSNAKEEMV